MRVDDNTVFSSIFANNHLISFIWCCEHVQHEHLDKFDLIGKLSISLKSFRDSLVPVSNYMCGVREGSRC